MEGCSYFMCAYKGVLSRAGNRLRFWNYTILVMQYLSTWDVIWSLRGLKNGVSNSVVLLVEIRWPVIWASPSKRVELYIICVHCSVYTATLGRSLLVGVVFIVGAIKCDRQGTLLHLMSHCLCEESFINSQKIHRSLLNNLASTNGNFTVLWNPSSPS